MDKRLLEAIAVTAELTGTELSKAAARVFAEDLSRYPLAQVLAALTRCRREVRGRLVLGDVVSRLDDGRPGPEEAWSMLPKHESDSVVWSDEMAHAFGVANHLLVDGDLVGARMAFKEAYSSAVSRARDKGLAPRWTPSYGHDRHGRAKAIREAADRQRITSDRALAMLSHLAPEYAQEHVRALAGPEAIVELIPYIDRKESAA